MDMEKIKAEALQRMNMLGLPQIVCGAYNGFNLITMSEPDGTSQIISDDGLKAVIKDIEQSDDIHVYYVIHSYESFGEMYTMLYVSEYEEEWYMDIDDIKNGRSCCYCLNITDLECSEYGLCGIESTEQYFKSLVRTW